MSPATAGATTARVDPRLIDRGTPPERYARGWHCLGLASTFRDGKPHEIWAFGTKLVVWADSSGALHVLDGYCRHMGGDLTQGTVKGDEIACPFHDWRWGGDGKCKAIPYAKRIPLRARTRTWTTLEQFGQDAKASQRAGGASHRSTQPAGNSSLAADGRPMGRHPDEPSGDMRNLLA